MTFPFSTHNYQLRFWMAVGGVDPDQDVRMVVLPPPFMADSLAYGQVDAFCVGAPWNSIAVDRGVGHILHFVSDILVRAAEKVLAVRQSWSERNPDVVAGLVRAAARGAAFVEENREEMARWGQTSISKDALRTAMGVFRPDLYDAALGKGARAVQSRPAAFNAFAGPPFDPEDLTGYLASFDVAKRA